MSAGGTFQLYADIPVSLGGLAAGSALFAATDRNDSVPSASPAAVTPPSPPSPPPSPAGDAPVRPPAPPADDVVPLRNPTIIMSYDRREGTAAGQARGGRAGEAGADEPLTTSSGFHDAALQMLKKMGMDGRACLLRAVCELSARPLRSNGLLGDLVNAVAE